MNRSYLRTKNSFRSPTLIFPSINRIINKKQRYEACSSGIVIGRFVNASDGTNRYSQFEKGYDEVRSSISVSNLPALNLYSSLGFYFGSAQDIYHGLVSELEEVL